MPQGVGTGRLWLIAGTGEGPRLARRFLEKGWRLRVSVVTHSASQPYGEDPRVEILVGELAGAEAVRTALEEAQQQGDPFQWLIDASHPFAARITATANAATWNRPERLLRLHRPVLVAPQAIGLGHMGELASHLSGGERLLLAIGSRHLKEAVRQGRGCRLHSRVLPHPKALRQALEAGLAPSRIACLRPTNDGAVEKALCHLWRIDTVLCRQSGGVSEALWLRIASELELRVLQLQRPAEPEGITQLPLEDLIKHVGSPEGPGDGGTVGWSSPRILGAGAHHRGQPGER